MPQELGAEVIRVLVRNADLFRAIAGGASAAEGGEAGQGEGESEGSLEQRLALETADETAVAVSEEARTARGLPLTLPTRAVQGVVACAGERWMGEAYVGREGRGALCGDGTRFAKLFLACESKRQRLRERGGGR